MHIRRLIVSLFAAVLSLGGLSASAQAQTIQACSGPTQVPSQNQVILYEHANYQGRCWLITVTSSYNEPWVENQGIPNDEISSLKVGIHTAIALWDHINNESLLAVYGSDSSTTFVSYVGNPINDLTSAFTISAQ